jgi:hypothetical protein
MKKCAIYLAALILTSATALAAETNPPPLTASELLDKFVKAQDQITSFIAKGEESNTGGAGFHVDYRSRFEMRFDGRRVSDRTWSWGKVTPERQWSREDPWYLSHLRGVGDRQYEYQHASKTDLGHVYATKPRRSPGPDCVTPLNLFYLWNDSDRVDASMREAGPALRLREKMESAGWVPSPCYVLEARTSRGRYTLWLDPAHGYQMAKAEFRQSPGDLVGTNRLKGNVLSLVRRVRFEQVAGIWVPMEAEKFSHHDAAAGGGTSEWHYKLTEFILNPDHDHLGSFVPDDVREGAMVSYMTASGGMAHGVWRKGQIVGTDGSLIKDVMKDVTDGKQDMSAAELIWRVFTEKK